MSGYKYNVKGVKTLYSNAKDKIGLWISLKKIHYFLKKFSFK